MANIKNYTDTIKEYKHGIKYFNLTMNENLIEMQENLKNDIIAIDNRTYVGSKFGDTKIYKGKNLPRNLKHIRNEMIMKFHFFQKLNGIISLFGKEVFN